MKNIFLATLMLLPLNLAAAPAGSSRVLDDFEGGSVTPKWQGPVQISREYASHGQSSLRVRFDSGNAEVSTGERMSLPKVTLPSFPKKLRRATFAFNPGATPT